MSAPTPPFAPGSCPGAPALGAGRSPTTWGVGSGLPALAAGAGAAEGGAMPAGQYAEPMPLARAVSAPSIVDITRASAFSMGRSWRERLRSASAAECATTKSSLATAHGSPEPSSDALSVAVSRAMPSMADCITRPRAAGDRAVAFS